MRIAVLVATLAVLGGLAAGALRRESPTLAEVETLAGMARVCVEREDYGGAVGIYSDLLERAGDLPYVRLGLAAAFFKQGDLARAEEQYRILLSRDADSPIVLFNLGKTLLRQNRSSEASEFLRTFAARYESVLPDLALEARRACDAPSTPGPKPTTK